jgi:hypothetical protein
MWLLKLYGAAVDVLEPDAQRAGPDSAADGGTEGGRNRCLRW